VVEEVRDREEAGGLVPTTTLLAATQRPGEYRAVGAVAGLEEASEEEEEGEHGEGDDAEEKDLDAQLPGAHTSGSEQVERAGGES